MSLLALDLYIDCLTGQGSFFKSHKDTPRGNNMFGSLVITFPTRHEGGQLALRHAGREHIHDPSAASYESDNQVSWAAFFSDVDHEVLPITTGHRVTLTYNLYFSTLAPRTRPARSEPLLDAFKGLLADKEFMSAGGRLAFGLSHKYPVPRDANSWTKATWRGVYSGLKGADSALWNAALDAGLDPHIRTVYAPQEGSEGEFLISGLWDGSGQTAWDSFSDVTYDFKDGLGSWSEKITPGWEDDKDKFTTDLEWVVPRNENMHVGSDYVYHGNEACLDTLYGDMALILRVPSVKKRVAHDEPDAANE